MPHSAPAQAWDALVRRVKAWQRQGAPHQAQWEQFCHQEGYYAYDPRLYSAEALGRFLEAFPPSGTLPFGGPTAAPPNMDWAARAVETRSRHAHRHAKNNDMEVKPLRAAYGGCQAGIAVAWLWPNRLTVAAPAG